MMRRLRRLVHGVLIALLCLVLLGNLWQIGARVLLHQELPSVFGYSQLTVLSGSMEPEISAGDLIIIHREGSYREGEVVSFWDQGGLTTHRIVGQEGEAFVTKGDFNNTQDSAPVAPSQIVGRVVLVVPLVGRAALFLRTPLGLLMLLIIGMLLLYVPDLAERFWQKGKRSGK